MQLFTVLKPDVLFPLLLSMFFGIFVGAIPGLTATMAVALIIPVTYYMKPIAGLAMVLGVSFTAIFAGDIPATFLRIPGTPASGAAILDGFELSKKGKGSLALMLDLFCSALGGLIGVIILITVSPPLAKFALKFTHFEYFWLGIFGLSMAAVLSRGNTVKGLMSATLGLLISTIGIDVTTGYPRFTFGVTDLMDGVSFIPAMIGLFGLSEVFKRVTEKSQLQLSAVSEVVKPNLKETFKHIWKHKFTLIRGALIGTFIGALPGAGADVAAWVSYGVEKNVSKDEELGMGSVRGVIAPTSANNAAIGGTWIPALVFGLPGDSITAIVLGAMLMYGLRPGPMIFTQSKDLVTQLFTVAVLIQILLLPIGWLGIKAFSLFVKLKTSLVMVAVTVFCIIGSYALRNSVFDVYVMFVFGLIGYAFEKLRIPLAPMILGLILGRTVEDNLRVGLIKTKGSFLPFLSRPISLMLFVMIVLVLIVPPLTKILSRKKV
ncbi:C4-dicarboxylate ABC transporter permease [Pseudothermotoga hypogea DSM 11164 = NBRC 106472]|uniref:C4-dicarboxylate ABC transporter permease n=1 Tax=Pseudothermotoga hypogea DSM 11164 = NBRC 106472 TaxID=1123384 RepID=A0A0X1KNS9_9THEM|nr:MULTISPECIES: tripartite tricarboxylate transporter permease [Pseudothermotoga]AJC72958.1 C4-dicarboxylate ABC transporter permease [Pseudothermotoga hypogea DSM 11164 = NBRC 106472]MBC7121948.1 tripartite tricarboxylate transporter permease [Pseudothermotoga sp.]MDI6862585.1 tripartite tricarboxylate transporter permease [Pseudothermotoga sp.]